MCNLGGGGGGGGDNKVAQEVWVREGDVSPLTESLSCANA